MKLKSIQYSQHNGSPGKWQLEGCTLNDINLIVGKNASGKTRTLNIIALLTHLLAGEKKPKYINGNFTLVFENEVIMSTNEQFVMDAVPLKYWLVIKRSTGKAKIYNYLNNKKLFDSFKFTGLSNFDFFSSNYYLKEE